MNDQLTNERLEALLREFLATDAASSEPSAELRRRVIDARENAATVPARRRPFTLAWRPPRALAAAGVAVAVVAVGVLSATLSGLLPLGRPDCSGVTIESVREAVVAVPGYTWRMTGTELIHRLIPGGDRTFDVAYATVPLEFTGAYDAPDAWRIDILQGYDPNSDFPLPPSTGGLVRSDVDGYLVVGGQPWVRGRGDTHYQPTDREDNVQIARVANELLEMVERGEPFGIAYESKPTGLDPSMRWTVDSTNQGCTMTGSSSLRDAHPELTYRVELVVNPDTLLPQTALYVFSSTPSGDEPLPTGTIITNEDMHLDFTYDYDASFTIDSPLPAGFESVTEAQARADATAAGLSSPFTSATFQLAEAQVYAIHTPSGTAVLLYQNGTLASSDVVPTNVDVYVDLVLTDDGDPKTFLVAVVNDPRVVSVEATFGNGETRQLGGYSVRPSVSSGENLGDIVTWVPLDDEGNEVEVDPPRP
jgi:hypothetical protein